MVLFMSFQVASEDKGAKAEKCTLYRGAGELRRGCDAVYELGCHQRRQKSDKIEDIRNQRSGDNSIKKKTLSLNVATDGQNIVSN